MREGFPEVMGVDEMVKESGRASFSGIRWIRDLPDFPSPVAVLAVGPIYLASEVRPFLAKHARKHIYLTKEQREEVHLRAADGDSDAELAQAYGVSVHTIRRIRTAYDRRGRR